MMPAHRFNVFGSLFDIERNGGEWRSYAVGADGKRCLAGFVVRSFVEEGELEQFLFDLFHERAARGKSEIFRVRRG
jgi:hypothetical protein